ncbi:hypothetical protein ALC56_05074 [Trachymyrmex septentrionalis]|uniref:Uncharacterized protein n=1 Tax=Trachymyrmex septentrionalis TaxID=34720 RepID=A0A195FIC5_9HYME|nr:hypothetical protein ALC56_05074 [Trachymyrmex septentrionalis]
MPTSGQYLHLKFTYFYEKNNTENYIPCICPTVSSRSNLSTPANNNIFGAGTFKNAVDNPLNQPNQCCSVFAKSILQTYFLLVVIAEGAGGGGGILDDSSSWIISSRGITGSGLDSHLLYWVGNESIS